MAHVEQNSVAKHKRRLEDVEEGLVSNDGTRLEVGIRPVHRGTLEELHRPEDTSDEDEAVAHVERKERLIELRVAYAMFPASVPEVGG